MLMQGILRGARAAPGAFWRWWTGELARLLPRRWRRGRGAALLAWREDDLVLLDGDTAPPAEIGRASLQGLDAPAQAAALARLLAARAAAAARNLRLCLDESQYLEKRVRLPLAAEENLRAVLGFEMDRYTPFKAAEVYFGWRVAARDAGRGAIELDLMLAPRRSVDALLARIEALGGRANSVVCMADLARPAPHADLLGQAPRPRAYAPRAWLLDLALACLFVALAAFALAIPLWQKHLDRLALMPLLETARKEAAAARAVGAELDKLTEEANHLLKRKHTQASAFALIEDLARALPDATWVDSLEIRPGGRDEVVLGGETAASSRLIELLENAGPFQNASFRSPLVKGEGAGAERFMLGAEIKPNAPPAPPAPR